MVVTAEHIVHRLLEASGNNPRKAGRLFERFVKAFLKTHNHWGKVFKNVWLWSEYPDRSKKPDTGIDLVAEDTNGDRWAIQAKFFMDSRINHEMVSKFIASAPPGEFKYRMLVYLGELTKNAEETLKKNNIYVINVEDELESIDWEHFDWNKPEEITYKRKEIRPYQREAVERVIKGFEENDRGKLIMPPGSGKTFVALKIAQTFAGKGGYVLFLVPSIALADQTLRAWLEDSDIPIRPFAVTSDASVGRNEDSIEKTTVLTIPPTTDPQKLTENASNPDPESMTVIVSTYQSIDVISQAQNLGLPEFDLIICDEAHYTTGLGDRNELSPFKKVHKNEHVKGKKRLYMTATPRVFSAGIKEKAREADLEIYDMNDEDVYGPTFYSYTFYRAVQEGYLTDYKVIVLTVSEKEVQEKLYEYLKEGHSKVEDAAKMVGVIRAFEGKIKGEETDVNIRRAVVFCSSIQRSKKVSSELPRVCREMESSLNVSTFHIDGSMSASERKRLLDWLRVGPQGEEDVRVLTNARVLTEGIDVPALDSVVFLDPRKSIVDIVQAMGRVMRKAPGKKYGYIVIPVVVSEDKPIEDQLEENKDFRTIWQVASALRSLDESFTARIRQIMVSGSGYVEKQEGPGGIEGEVRYSGGRGTIEPGSDEVLIVEFSEAIPQDLREKLKKAIVPKIVERVGGKKYLETWAKDVAKRVKRILRHVSEALRREQEIQKDFEEFLKALREVINPAISEEEAKSMLVQHMITKPIFEAIFEGYEFLKDNPVAQTIEKLSNHFTKFIEKETEDLEDFYREVKIRVKGINKEAERQDFLRQLYDSFFKLAFPDVADRLGIVYTPVELIDFLIKSVEDILREDFNSSLNDENIVILEPFAGTGTFLTRLMNFLDTEALKRKYQNGEIWGNEILLLPYYIALTNIESTYFDRTGEYRPFKYLLLTDTFELDEKRRKRHQLSFGFFPQSYTELMKKENKARINVIISNPPWRAGQKDATDMNKSLSYETIDEKIRKTYVAKSNYTTKASLYDSYVRAVRYASDRVGDNGVIAFVLNNGFIDSNSFDGFRKTLTEEFKKIYVFNLRGNARKQGEERRKEGDGIFGEGSRAGVALLILVKDKKGGNEPAEIYYYQVEDYLKRNQKLKLLKDFGSVKNVPWEKITPDEDGNWINQGSEEFKRFVSVEDIFEVITFGIVSSRDHWVYDFSKEKLREKMERFIEEYNSHVKLIKEGKIKTQKDLSKDKTKISWSRTLINAVFSPRAKEVSFESEGQIRKAIYRPFVNMWLYFSRLFLHEIKKFPQIFPTEDAENRVMFFTGTGANKDFSVLMTDGIVEYGSMANTVSIPFYIYISPEDAKKKTRKTLFSSVPSKFYTTVKLGDKTYGRRLNIKYEFYKKLKDQLKADINPEDIFYYVYAVISNPEYGRKYTNDLKRERPRIPIPKNVEAFNKLVEIGKRLADLHVNYESAPEYPLEVEIKGDPNKIETYFPDIRIDKNNPSVIRYNEYISLKGIPKEAYEWKIAGRSPLEWIAEYVRPRRHKDSGIVIDPADYIKETGDKEYFIRLIKKVVSVSLETRNYLKQLAELKYIYTQV